MRTLFWWIVLVVSVPAIVGMLAFWTYDLLRASWRDFGGRR